MICKLCLKEKGLLKKSHIVPNFLYRELRDEDNAFVKANLAKVTKENIYTGLFEPNILCAECDNVLLGKLEDYSSKILYGGKIAGVSFSNEINQNGVEYIGCYGEYPEPDLIR